ncbi:MAG: choice-of-anchor I family protein [Flavobacteriales bacterium]|nr:choice-of-anchor I family protein [Flavobacteriales bacterium]
MKKLLSLTALSIFSYIHAISQTTIGFWNFNFGNDNNVSTGTTLPAVGSGSIALVGGTTATFATGHSNDPNTNDNSGYNTTNYPAQGTNPKTAGIQINVNTTGLDDIQIEFWQRLSNTAANTWVLQYTLDVTQPVPVWVDAQTYTFTPQPTGTGDTWYFRTYNFSTVNGLNNNPNAAFRIVSAFDPLAGQYLAARSTSTYNTAGTSRFDLIKIYAAPNPSNVSLTNASYSVLENVGSVNVGVSLTAAGGSPVKVKLKWLSGTTATMGTDVTASNITTVSFSGLQDSIAQVSFPIINDALAERTEYFAFELLDSLNALISGTKVSTIYIKDDDYTPPVGNNTIQLQHIHSYQVGAAGTNSSEISAYDASNQRLYIANSVANKLEILNMSNPYNITPIASIPLGAYGKINSVIAHNGIVALALENNNPQLNGFVVFMDQNGNYLNQVTVGAMPDMLTFTHDYSKILTANEGEPNANYTVDPEGSVSIIDISGGITTLTQANVTTVGFTSFNANITSLRNAGIRIYGPSATVAKDFEPEYITIDPTNTKAYITLQENNAIAVLDIPTATITNIYPLGYKDHSLPGNALDISDQGGNIHIANWPIKGMYMPDAIASYEFAGQLYLVTANEGDARDYPPAYSEEIRLGNSSYILDTAIFGDMTKVLKPNLNAGRLTVTNATGDANNNGKFEEIHVFGTRSFSIWNATTGSLVYDSGDDFEQITLADPVYGAIFNADHSGVTIKNRSDNKGPEPEGVVLATINDTVYAFVSMERIGGIMIYNITNPANPQFVQYINNRSTTNATLGDRGAEGIIYIPYTQSPIDTGLVIISNEVSSTISVYKVNHYFQPDPIANFNVNNQVICAGGTIQFNDASQYNPTSWVWSFPGGQPSISFNPNPLVTYNNPGTYNVTLTVTNAYGSNSITLNNFIQVNPLPNVTIGGTTPICEGDNIHLNAGGGTNYSWYGPAGFNSNLQNPIISNASLNNSGIYTVSVVNAHNCSASQSISIVVNPTPVASVASNSPVCEGENIHLNASGGDFYSWSGPNGFVNNMENPIIVNSTLNNAGDYTVNISNIYNCSTTATINITVNSIPVVVAQNNSPICTGDDLELYSTGGISYNWSGPQGYHNSLQNPIIDNAITDNAGLYIVNVTDANGCTNVDTTQVIIYSLPDVVAYTNAPICEGDNLIIQAEGGIEYEWIGPNNFYSQLQNFVIINATSNQQGVYTVTATNQEGCTNTNFVYAEILNCNSVEESDLFSSLKIYPIPADEFIQLEFPEDLDQPMMIRLLSTDGKSIQTYSWNESTLYRMDVSTLTSGTYIIQINSGTSLLSKIILIAR